MRTENEELTGFTDGELLEFNRGCKTLEILPKYVGFRIKN
jgi:hypothetical protein